MANYDRDTGENYSTVADLARIGGALVGFAALVAGVSAGVSAEKKTSQKLDIQNQIANCDKRINDLSSGFLGSWVNSDQIKAEKKKRAELQNKYSNL